MKTFLTIGTDSISEDLFLPIEDPTVEKIKPSGGLWFTEFDEEIPFYNIWIQYLISNPAVFCRKNTSPDIFKQKAAVIELKKESKIYTLDSIESLEELKNKYPAAHSNFSYEAMANDYDGIIVDVQKLVAIDPIFRKYDVKSLILFTTSAIDHYRSAEVDFEPFDVEFFNPRDVFYHITVSEDKKEVSRTSPQYEQLIKELSTIVHQQLNENYPNYKEMDRHTLSKCIYGIAVRSMKDCTMGTLQPACRAILKTYK